ncbi:MAG TPA: 50S ribosomal protein L19 [Bacillota bacterium]|nr:50S ribosomal protein L19 [Bacillota bacterium]
MNILEKITKQYTERELADFRIGDTVKVYIRIVEGTRTRTQIFEGVVISKKNGGISETFTVRRVAYGVGTEKTFPLHSPNVQKVEVIRKGKVRRAKLYYLRGKIGKSAKIKERK